MAIQAYDPKNIPAFQNLTPIKNFDSIYIESNEDPVQLLDLLPESGLAVVGTRYPQRRSFELLDQVVHELAGTDLIVISGFARGIDSRAHELAIESGLKTIAVLGCGIDVDYPKENRILRKKILNSGGCLISQFARNAPAFASNFLDRNRLIAGLSKATWVVEAAEVSGTLNTANWAMRQNRNLYATSCYPGDPFFKGNEKLLSQKSTNRYPIAEPLFGSHSLSTTWAFLSEQPSLEFGNTRIKPQTLIQRLIVELQTELGSCPIQTLMNYAATNGMTLGAFYREFEKEIELGSILQDESGRITLNRQKNAALEVARVPHD